jgi:phage tail sheath protein FI
MSAYMRKITPRFTFDDNPLDKGVLDKLQRVCSAIKATSAQLKKVSIVVFSGPISTGKTIAAEVLAQGLSLDLFRIDLSRVLSKYITETEKNLDRVFTEAESSHIILFFGEADALFGKRSEVNEGHDRYADFEMAYLMRRIETYKGIVIISTNKDEQFEGAFVEQVLYPVKFPHSPIRKESPTYTCPGVYVEETGSGSGHSITGVSTSIAAFIGKASKGKVDTPTRVTSFSEFADIFGGFTAERPHLAAGVFGFFDNGGKECWIVRIRDDGSDEDYIGKDNEIGMKTGLQTLKNFRDVSIVCIPGITSEGVQHAMIEHCETMRDRFCILDSEEGAVVTHVLVQRSKIASVKGYGALYYPWINAEMEIDASARAARIEALVPPSGHIAGIYARTDVEQGVHKAPAGKTIQGAIGLGKTLNASEQDRMNLEGVNCIRIFPGRGILVWGARTVSTDPEWKYVNVRRLMIFLEQSIQEGSQWVVFEPSGEPTWMKVKSAIEAFLIGEWRNGALQGRTHEEAFFVRCDRTTMTQNDIDEGRIVCLIGVAILRSAEFHIFRILCQAQAV